MNPVVVKYDTLYTQEKPKDFNMYPRNKVLDSLFTKPELVLDLAGGDGYVSEWLRDVKGCSILLVDFSKEALKIAKYYRSIKHSYKVNIDRNKLPFLGSSIDVVFWGDNIEHVFNPLFVMSEVSRVLKKGGRLIMSFPNMDYWYYRYYYLKTGFLPCTENDIENKQTWNWQHIRFFNKSIINEMLKKTGLKLNKVIGVNAPENKLQCLLMKKLPELFGSVIIVEAVK